MRQKNGLVFSVAVVVAGCMPDYVSDLPRRGGPHEDAPTRPEEEEEPVTPAPGPPSVGSAPSFGPTVRQADPPPPLSGGTIAVAPDEHTVVAADPDRDRVYVIDIRTREVKTVSLALHDEPGRVAIDAASRAHVLLRSGGAVVTIDMSSASIIERRDVCPAPRGIAFDPTADVLHIACGGGELVTWPAGGGREIQRRFVARDLRDVAVLGDGLAISTFRRATILRTHAGSDVISEQAVASSPAFGAPHVAWRMIAAPSPETDDDSVDVLVAAQRAPDASSVTPPPAAPASYYGLPENPCSPPGPSPVVHDGSESVNVPNAVLPVDVAATKDVMVVVAAGNGHTANRDQLVFLDRRPPARSSPSHAFTCSSGWGLGFVGAQLTSAAFAKRGAVVVALSREPAMLVVVDVSTMQEEARIALATESREDTGHAIFHSNSGAGAACASCHPDGRDDGHAWRSVELGARRTPSLLGTLANTAPYHWTGEAKDMTALVQLTFESRMKGQKLAPDQLAAIEGWLGALRAPPAAPPSDAAAAQRGKALFEGAATCASCHSGAMMTNNASRDVGTGGVFQVPPLVGVGWRAPYLHDGSAESLGAVLTRGHAGTALQPKQIADLTTYLETL